jgi:hypothetical protein
MKKLLNIIFAFSLLFAACSKGTSEPSMTNSNGAGDNFDGQAGRGGSLARFTIAQNHLYVVDEQKLYTYSLSNSTSPQLTSTVQLGMDIETIFSFKDKLFIGSRSAMYIYSISSPASPQSLGMASHIRACDPVVANDSIAYVTVRNGSTCGGNVSALIVYDVRNVLNPSQVRTITMETPYGLGTRDKRLYICNGPNGLNIYNLANPTNPSFIKKFTDETYFDVIPTDNLLICMVQGGMVLYGYDQNAELVKLAKISQ